MATRTIKLPYNINKDDHARIKEYISNYNNVLRFTYNRLVDSNFSISTKELTALQKSMNNIFIDSHFLNSAQYESKQFKGKDKVIFGGKYNMVQRCKGKISKDEFFDNRLVPIYSVGEACKNGNRKFQIVSEKEILFKPSRNEHFALTIPKLHKNYRKDIILLKELQDNCKAPLTYKLGLKYVTITFEDSLINNSSTSRYVCDRVFAIDLNPNYIGWSVVDWKNSESYKVIDAGVISNKSINDLDYKLHAAPDSKQQLHLNNKRSFENNDSAKRLAELALHYQCELFSIEKLELTTQDNKRGKSYNKLVNNLWNRQVVYQRIRKYCDRFKIKFYEVVANYSSFEGNLIYRKTGLPDMCLASIELGRRAYEFHHQYVLQDRPKIKNIMFDTSEKAHDQIVQSLEELHYKEVFEDIKSLYKELKTLDLKYRVPIEKSILKTVSSKKSIKSKVLLYSS